MKVYQCVYASFPFGFEGGMWDLIVLLPDYCFPFNCTKVDSLSHSTEST